MFATRVAALGFGRRVDSLRQFSSQIIKNNNNVYFVDTLAQVRRLEERGLPSKQAEAITATITEVLNDSLVTISQSILKSEMSGLKSEMQRVEMIQDSNLSKFKSEVKSSQEHHIALYQKEIEKLLALLQKETDKLRGDDEKLHSELRYEIDKVTAGHRLDLNLEKGHLRDEVAKLRSEFGEIANKFEREIHVLRTQVEAAKYDIIKYFIGTLVSISAVGLAVARILM